MLGLDLAVVARYQYDFNNATGGYAAAAEAAAEEERWLKRLIGTQEKLLDIRKQIINIPPIIMPKIDEGAPLGGLYDDLKAAGLTHAQAMFQIDQNSAIERAQIWIDFYKAKLSLFDKESDEYKKLKDQIKELEKIGKPAADTVEDMSKYYDAAAAGAGRLVKALYEGEDAGKAMLSVAMQLASAFIPGPFGSFLGGLFDDPLNDARLVRKSRSATQDILKERHRMAGFVAEGAGQAIRDSGGSLPSSGAVSMGDISVIIQGNADESTVEKVREVLRNELPQMIKDGEVAVPTTDRRHGR